MKVNQSNERMPVLLQFQTQHVCISAITTENQFDYCRICHVLLPQNFKTKPNSEHFLRTKEYSNPESGDINPNQILQNMIKNQTKNRYFNLFLRNSNARHECINWVKQLCQNFQFSQNCFHLSVALFDAVLSLYASSEHQFRLVAFLSMYMAAKQLENEPKLPLLKNIVQFFGAEFTKEDFMEYEIRFFKIFEWNLNLQTPFSFLSFFFSRGIVSDFDLLENDRILNCSTIKEEDYEIKKTENESKNSINKQNDLEGLRLESNNEKKQTNQMNSAGLHSYKFSLDGINQVQTLLSMGFVYSNEIKQINQDNSPSAECAKLENKTQVKADVFSPQILDIQNLDKTQITTKIESPNVQITAMNLINFINGNFSFSLFEGFAAKIQKKIVEFSEIALKNYDFYNLTSIIVAVSCIAAARKFFGLQPWTSDLEILTGVQWQTFETQVDNILNDYQIIIELESEINQNKKCQKKESYTKNQIETSSETPQTKNLSTKTCSMEKKTTGNRRIVKIEKKKTKIDRNKKKLNETKIVHFLSSLSKNEDEEKIETELKSLKISGSQKNKTKLKKIKQAR